MEPRRSKHIPHGSTCQTTAIYPALDSGGACEVQMEKAGTVAY